MSKTRKDITKLIKDIYLNNSLIDSISPSLLESLVTEIVAQNKKITEIYNQTDKGIDYIAKFRDGYNKTHSFAVEVKKMNQLIELDAIQKFQKNISSLNLDKGYYVTNANLTDAAKRLAEQYKEELELIDRFALRNMIVHYEQNREVFSERLFDQLNKLELNNLINIYNPSSEQIEQIQPETTDLSEPQKNALITVDSLPLKLVSKILKSPKEMKNLSPRQFEKFVAETLNQLGFKEIVLTPRSRDGGKDVVASYQINGIPLSFYFECKKYSEDNKVQLETLRALLGTLSHDARDVNMGVLVTTSTFTKGSKQFILSESRLDGKDYDGILGWIDELNKKI